MKTKALLTVLPLLVAAAAPARASEFGDCFQRVDLACREAVQASYGCTGRPKAGEPKACSGHPNETIIVRGQLVQCDSTCSAPRSALDQCVAAAATHCASLLEGAGAKAR
ncbi:MAG TPA: hypothetical protein VEI82_10535 [Myxococcota bacterium]|nr:hypothetical protein [Myxococcota bacterium]